MTGGNPSDPPHPFSNDATDKPTTPNTDLIRDIETISTLKNEWNTTLVCTLSNKAQRHHAANPFTQANCWGKQTFCKS
jgi:hypothetical protein